MGACVLQKQDHSQIDLHASVVDRFSCASLKSSNLCKSSYSCYDMNKKVRDLGNTIAYDLNKKAWALASSKSNVLDW
jgi:hypothetical protein